ncbi:MAG: adenylate kinase [Acidobacteriota bacterium]|nr:adenylate kinase [Acidobacteriota bacterium]
MRVVFLGPPGSGKGTQAKLLGKRLGVPAISTGDILREAVRRETALGRRAKAIMEAGELVPDDVVIGLIRERLDSADAARGFVLDGFPRTVEQAQALDRLLEDNGTLLDAVVNFAVPVATLLERLLGRAEQEGRSDDRPETIRERLRVYGEKNDPLVRFYEAAGFLTRVDGFGAVDDVTGRVDRVLSGTERAARRA